MAVISVIIPVYNAEPYLDRCLSSVCDQKHRDLDIIVVEDGSSDRCPQICDEWAAKDSRIRVVHKKHGPGVAAARNAGLDRVRGDWVAWVDSDDWIEPDYLFTLMSAIEQSGADFGVALPCRDSAAPAKVLHGTKAILREQLQGFRPVLLNTLIKAERFQNVRFRDFRIGEDTTLLTEIAYASQMEVLIGSQGYHHLYREDSVSHEHNIVSMRSWLVSVQWRNDYIRNRYPSAYRYVHYDSVENGARILRQLRDYPADPEVEAVRRDCRALVRKHLLHVPLSAIWYGDGRIRELLSAVKIIVLG